MHISAWSPHLAQLSASFVTAVRHPFLLHLGLQQGPGTLSLSVLLLSLSYWAHWLTSQGFSAGGPTAVLLLSSLQVHYLYSGVQPPGFKYRLTPSSLGLWPEL